MASPPSPSAGCFAHVATKQTDTTSKCTIPFGLPPEPETTRFAETHCITLKQGLDRPNGTWDSQGEALSKHELSRIHHEFAINIHRLFVFHRVIVNPLIIVHSSPIFCEITTLKFTITRLMVNVKFANN